MNRLRLLPYQLGSGSARALAEEVGRKIGRPVLRLRREDHTGNISNFRGGPQYGIVNWGCPVDPSWYANVPLENFLNHPASTNDASNKLKFFRRMAAMGLEDKVPSFASNFDNALELMEQRGRGAILVVRTTLRGHSGQGIHLYTLRQVQEGEVPQEHQNAPLYTIHHRHRDEYRVHVFGADVIDFSMKKRRADYEGEVSTHVRSHQNGWVFCREDVQLPDSVADAALAAVAGVGLDFGAVDVAYRRTDDKAVALEINTAPGLEGTTLQRYSDRIVQWFNSNRN